MQKIDLKRNLKITIVGAILFIIAACSNNSNPPDKKTIELYKEKNQQIQPKREHSGY